ncbi:hypothetical protein HUS23_05175 [Ectothiorhodospiraceae bacterium 2226]|nr:hypothetical protein HUS23_05175 [Ectothiorhodospiraceae bacterium 2226]
MRVLGWCTGALLVLSVHSVPAQAEPWQFDSAMPVTAAQGAALFHQLEAAGRRSVAASGATVAVAWTDNRDGAPRAYVAFRQGGAFTGERRVSGERDAYEPAITGLGDGRFVVVWEEDDAVWARVVGPESAGAPLSLSKQPAAYPTVAARAGRVYAAWAEQAGRHKQIVVAELGVQDDAAMDLVRRAPADAEVPAAEQSYPALAVTESGVAVAWEDRRHGHTRLFHAYAATAAEALTFSTHRLLNEQPPRQSEIYGQGSGVARVSLAARDEQVLAVWMDKRVFEFGYKIYAALSTDGGRRFGANEAVQDVFGGTAAQWHPAAVLGPEGAVAVWEDTRDDVSDILLSWREGADSWSDDLYVPPASGGGYQGAPAMAADAEGNLHLVWLNRESQNGPTELLYSFGKRAR